MSALGRLIRRVWPVPDRVYFERWDRRSEDPWGHLASDYERRRYEWTLAALGGRRFGRALEMGCSLGGFTEMLAPYCDEVLGVDISEVSVERARARLAGAAHVRVERRTLPREMPAGPFDLVVCADVLYYWTAAELSGALRQIEAAVASGGVLLLVHYRPKVRVQPLRGDEVHDLVARETRLALVAHDERGDHRLDLFEDR
ncbi:MAG: nodulation S family protein [Actinomycetota bacterium]|nr:nodulation S family protein [Actinomycetota bacterium]